MPLNNIASHNCRELASFMETQNQPKDTPKTNKMSGDISNIYFHNLGVAVISYSSVGINYSLMLTATY